MSLVWQISSLSSNPLFVHKKATGVKELDYLARYISQISASLRLSAQKEFLELMAPTSDLTESRLGLQDETVLTEGAITQTDNVDDIVKNKNGTCYTPLLIFLLSLIQKWQLFSVHNRNWFDSNTVSRGSSPAN